MAEIPRNYLDKKGAWKPIKLLDLAILLYHVHKGSKSQHVGFDDSRETLEMLTKSLNKVAYVDLSQLESALFSANLMDENNKFWHPKGLTFEEFVKQIVGSDTYNRKYGIIEKKE